MGLLMVIKKMVQYFHMATMYNYGLYNYDLVFEGREGINTLLDKALDPSSQTLAGVPEYFTDRGWKIFLFNRHCKLVN